MTKLLEVIVTSVHEAREAEAGGADRLELVRSLDVGGLTPDNELVREVVRCVSLPVRVMLREEPLTQAESVHSISTLEHRAASLSGLAIDGLVAGFVTAGGQVDIDAMRGIMAAAPGCSITFHRAFDELTTPTTAIEQLKSLGAVDRILTVGGKGEWEQRKARLLAWQRAAEPEITILFGAGIAPLIWTDLQNISEVREVHAGRAARLPNLVSGVVQRDAVRRLKTALS